MSDLRSMVRELLLEELDKNRPDIAPSNPVQVVEIRNDHELNAFVMRVMDMSKKQDVKADIQSGKLKFSLSGSDLDHVHAESAVMAELSTRPTDFEKGLVTEKDISRLKGNIIHVGNTVCFTPLARDEIRRRGIKIERKSK